MAEANEPPPVESLAAVQADLSELLLARSGLPEPPTVVLAGRARAITGHQTPAARRARARRVPI